MRLLFLSAPLPGHLDWGGYLPTAAALRRRGHEVLWASGAAVKAAVTGAGVPFHTLAATGWRWPPPPPLPAPQNADDPAWRRQRALRALDQWLDEARVGAASAELLAVVQSYRPDVVVSEMFVAAAGIVAELAGVPFAGGRLAGAGAIQQRWRRPCADGAGAIGASTAGVRRQRPELDDYRGRRRCCRRTCT